MQQIFESFAYYLKADNIAFDPESIFKNNLKQLMNISNIAAELTTDNFVQRFITILSNGNFLDSNLKQLLKLDTFWNGNRLMRKKIHHEIKAELTAQLEQARDYLSDYILHSFLIREHQEILEIAQIIYKTYDRIKFRDSIFTYDDISYYTYRFLYDPEISLFDSGSVLNIFYEFLSYNIRFLLIDEFQDTSVIQWSILQPIISEIISGDGVKEYGGAILVGDEKQSIYGWRGGERDLLLKAGHLLQREEKPEKLECCFRYSQFISQKINTLFSNDRLHNFLKSADIDWSYHNVSANDTSLKGYVDFALTNLADEAFDKRSYFEHFVIEDLIPLINKGSIDVSDTVILARKNKDLAILAEVLSAHNIPYLMESSNSVFQHIAIKPIIYLLRYLVVDDIMDLLRFLRSDIVLYSAVEMKEIISLHKESENRTDFFSRTRNHPIMQSIGEISGRLDNQGLTSLIRNIIEIFKINLLYPTELDLRNLHYFLEISSNFYKGGSDISASVEHFLDFIEEHSESSDFNQVGLEQSEVIRLMSVHKSKGLQFSTVFFLYDANPTSAQNRSPLHLSYQFDPYYRGISPLLMTLNYGVILNYGSCKPLHQLELQKRMIEELNSLYVAVTRVKKHLIIRGFYNLKKGFQDLIGKIDPTKESSINRIFTISLAEICDIDLSTITSGFSFKEGMPEVVEAAVCGQETGASVNWQNQLLLSNQRKETNGKQLQPFDIELIKREQASQQRGIVIHEYLSYITFAEEEEITGARDRIVMKYGTILEIGLLEQYIAIANKIIVENQNYFSREYWDDVYNELVVFDEKKNEKRIDRMVVNHRLKKIMILDYKTGEHQVPDQKQLDEYKAIIENLDIMQQDRYEIKTEFIK